MRDLYLARPHDMAYNLTGKIELQELSMEAPATTKMTSKGQVVIPQDVRTRLGLEPGVRFVVVGADDVVILKTIKPPSMKDFDSLIRRARRQARAAGMKRSDLARAVARTRRRT